MENNVDSTSVQNPNSENSNNPKIKKFLHDALDIIKFTAIALAIVIPVRMFVGQPFMVSGVSMVPTFLDRQYLIVDEISYHVKGPHRGDVVIFKYPKNPSRFFIKRIIGMPNEKIDIKDGVVKISNESNPDGFTLNEPYINEKFNTTGTWVTGANEYFVMGDNRNLSSDSRVWGILPRKFMIGRAYLRLLPFNKISYLPGAYPESK